MYMYNRILIYIRYRVSVYMTSGPLVSIYHASVSVFVENKYLNFAGIIHVQIVFIALVVFILSQLIN